MNQSSPAVRPATSRAPALWVPSLYLAEGLPYVMVMTVSVIMYKDFGLTNTANALWTSLLYLPWTIKPLWSPVVDLLGTRRNWIWPTQLLMGLALLGAAFAAPLPNAFQWTLAVFWLMAISSATHDIAADGFYMLALSDHDQANWVGIRSTFYRIAMILGQGQLVVLAGEIKNSTGDVHHAWSIALGVVAAALVILGLWHSWVLPRPAADRAGDARRIPEFMGQFAATFGAFFRKPGIGTLLAFLLMYRFGEAQLVKMVSPFLLDARAKGGLGLTTADVGWVYGTVGVIALLLGGISGGIVVARHGLKRWLWPMLFAIHVPDAVFIYLAYTQPANILVTTACVALEQFGYGFGLTAFLLYMIYVSRGEHPTAHYAICTGFMAMGMMFPGMWSGWLEDHIGYRHFFTWVIFATIPSFFIASRLPLDPEFGKKKRAAA